ncbi:MAG: transposase [Rubripirellula sp.]
MASGSTASRLDEEAQRRLTVAGILRRHAAEFVRQFPSQACPQVQNVLAKQSVCRTEVLGARWYRCPGCQSECKLYNSCGDRHCPQCSGSKRAEWVEKTETLLIQGVSYFQVVLTLPSELSSLALGNRRAIYDLLFTASWRALKQTVESEQRYQMAAAMVLHTWNQKLESHGHVHALVPGGGPSLDRPGSWRSTKRHGTDNPFYLVDASELRSNYRKFFLEGLGHLHARGGLKLEGDFAYLQDPAAWREFIRKLESTKWVGYIEPPPKRDCQPEHVVRYLGRYLTGGPISDRRLISANESEVRFWAREGSVMGGSRKSAPYRLTTTEFVRRWSLHILPKGYVKTRRFGGWSNKHRSSYLDLCRQLLGVERPTDDAQAECDEMSHACCCPACGEQMTLEGEIAQPSWSELRERGSWPRWYEASG